MKWAYTLERRILGWMTINSVFNIKITLYVPLRDGLSRELSVRAQLRLLQPQFLP